jgi:hypothetical protein
MLWTLWLLWALVLTCAVLGVVPALRSSSRHAIFVLMIALLALALRGGFTRDHFYGLEYEDAYVYAAASRQSAWGNPGSGFGGLTVCAVGSLQDCSESEVFPGHLPGFPALLRGVQAMVGYRVWLAPAVGALISSLATVAIWWSAWAIYGSFSAATAAALLFAVTPVLSLYGGSATSESVSSLPIAVAVGAAAMARKRAGVRPQWTWYVVVLCAVVLAATVRRENAILIGVLPACLLIRPRISRAGKWCIVLVSLAVAVSAARLVFPSAAQEVGEYGEFSFGLGRFLETVPTILHALVIPQWFGAVSVMAAIGVVAAAVTWRDQRRQQDVVLLFAVAIAALGMMALYGAHVRSTYQLMGVRVEPFDFLRYLTNIGVFLCLLTPAAARFGGLLSRPSVAGQRVVFAMAGSYIALSVWASWTLRREMMEVEQRVRTEPALAAIAAASATGDRYPIVTLEPLVAELFGTSRTKVIALPFLTRERVAASGGRVLYLRQDHYENDVNRRRYAEFLSALPVEEAIELQRGDGWVVVSMGKERPASVAVP